MEYQLNRPDFDTVIDYCNDMLADEKLIVYEFGKNADLVLHIYKDSDYDPSNNIDEYNLVTISTAQNGRWVDDTGDVYITDGSLQKELERINEYKDFSEVDFDNDRRYEEYSDGGDYAYSMNLD